METKITLRDETIDGLKSLVRINLDSAAGFEKVAEKTERAELRSLFSEKAKEREQNARELRGFVEINDEEAQDVTSISSKFHRWWIDVSSSVDSDLDERLLKEAERGEDSIKDEYQSVMKDIAGNPVSDVLHRQCAGVMETHDRIRDLRDREIARNG